MAFIALDMTTISMIGERGTREYELMDVTNEYDDKTAEMASRLEEINSNNTTTGTTPKPSLADDTVYQELQVKQQELSTKKASLETRLKFLNETIASFQKAVENGAKSAGKVFGGGG